MTIKTYTIEEGQHYCNGSQFATINTKKMNFEARLHPNCWYDPDMFPSWHLNKGWGWSTDLFNRFSNRWTWRPSTEKWKFELYAYPHINGTWVRQDKLRKDLLGIVEADELFLGSISLTDYEDPLENEATYNIGMNTVVRHYPTRPSTGWRQRFYFGGKPVAPWAMSAEIGYEI